jgi:hypothetical protein
VAVPQVIPSRGGQGATLSLTRRIPGDQLALGYIGALAADAQGLIYALETTPGARSIVLLDSLGRGITRYGRTGQGPGEFQSLAHTLAWLGDSLLAFDSRAARLTAFDRTGRPALLRDWPGGTPMPARIIGGRNAAHGLNIRTVFEGGPPTIRAGQPITSVGVVNVVRIGRDGSASVLTAVSDTVRGRVAMQCAAPASDILPFVELPFRNPLPLHAVTPAGEIVRGHLDKYQIDLLEAATGRVLRSITRQVASRALTDADLARTMEGAELLSSEREGGGKLIVSASTRTACPIYAALPKTGPPLRSVTADDAGRIWVESVHPSQPGQHLLHVYDPNGRLTAEAVMPQRDARIAPYVRGNSLYLVQVDDLGVQSIAIYRLTGGTQLLPDVARVQR